MNSFMYYTLERRKELIAAGIKPQGSGDYAKTIATQWNNLSETEKEKYKILAAEDKER